jgi:hypothetical protein
VEHDFDAVLDAWYESGFIEWKPIEEEKLVMTNDRVLGRRGARLVTEVETTQVNGAIATETACSFDPQFGLDGDTFTGDCGHAN